MKQSKSDPKKSMTPSRAERSAARKTVIADRRAVNKFEQARKKVYNLQ